MRPCEFGCASGTCKGESRLFQDGRSGRDHPGSIERGVNDDVKRWLEFPSERRPDVREGSILWGRKSDREEQWQRFVLEGSAQELFGDRFVTEQGCQKRREQPMLVFGTLCPGRNQVGELESTGRRAALLDSAVTVPAAFVTDLAAEHVFAHVVQVQINGRGVLPGDPILCGSVECDLDPHARQCLALYERTERLIHVVDHLLEIRSATETAAPPSRVAGRDNIAARRCRGTYTRRGPEKLGRPPGPVAHLATLSSDKEGRMPQYLSPGVYVEEVEGGSRPIEGVGTAVAAFVGLAEKGELNAPTLITNWSQFTQAFGGFVEGSYLAHAVYGYLNNGGGACYVVRIGKDGAAPAARAELVSATDKTLSSYRVSALNPGTTGNDITVEVADSKEGGDDAFTVVVKRGGKTEETFPDVTAKKGKQNVATIVNAQSKLIRIEEVGSASALERRPASGAVALSGGGAAAPARLSSEDYVGDPADRTGFGGLEAVDPITMVCVPDLMAAYQGGMIDLDGVQAVQQAMLAHCELMGDRVAILDPPPGLNAQQVHEWRVAKAGYDSKYATLYWPWIKVLDPLSGDTMAVPPSGHVAGVWGRSDDTRGVHKAPANEVVRGALSLQTQITKQEHDLLNPAGINCIRAFPGRGIRIWGARTLSSDQAWRYLNVRRLFNYLEESILEGTQWVVFEPNDLDLWQRIRREITAFLMRVWRDGALFGTTPEQAFYVKCDEETNPPEVVDAGQVICEIGVAPVKPAEFVVFRLSQFSGGAVVNE
jgi:phage tail sheath protein FI